MSQGRTKIEVRERCQPPMWGLLTGAALHSLRRSTSGGEPTLWEISRWVAKPARPSAGAALLPPRPVAADKLDHANDASVATVYGS